MRAKKDAGLAHCRIIRPYASPHKATFGEKILPMTSHFKGNLLFNPQGIYLFTGPHHCITYPQNTRETRPTQGQITVLPIGFNRQAHYFLKESGPKMREKVPDFYDFGVFVHRLFFLVFERFHSFCKFLFFLVFNNKTTYTQLLAPLIRQPTLAIHNIHHLLGGSR